jgi:malonyl CoA-acyl carrier protein transacylase
MLELTSIVLFVFGILQIILFFKVWGMTNDISKMRELMEAQSEKQTANPNRVQQLVESGCKAEAEETLEELANKLSSDIMNQKISVKVARERFTKLEEQYKSLGQDIPDYIAALKDML